MNRWTLAALLVGIGLGYLLAEVAREPAPRRASRSPEVEAGEEVSTTGVRTTVAPAPRPRAFESRRARAAVVEPALENVAETEDGEGLLRVDFAGLPDAAPEIEIHGTDIEGREEFEEYRAEEGTRVEVPWPAGLVRVRWTDGGAMHRCEARVRIRAGLATDVDASDPRYRLPEPAGLAVLTVRVPAAGAGWSVGAEVLLYGEGLGGGRWLSAHTDLEGRARFRVTAGAYALHVGTLEQTVTLAAAERRKVEVAHGARGDVVVEPACPGRYTLWRNNRGLPFPAHRGRAERVFLDEGVYDLRYRFGDVDLVGTFRPPAVSLGSIRIAAGRRTEVRHEGRPGALDVRVDVSPVPDAAKRRWSVGIGRGVPTPLQAGDEGLVARIERIEPGSYRVEVLADGEQRARTWAVVGFDSTTRVNVSVAR